MLAMYVIEQTDLQIAVKNAVNLKVVVVITKRVHQLLGNLIGTSLSIIK